MFPSSNFYFCDLRDIAAERLSLISKYMLRFGYTKNRQNETKMNEKTSKKRGIRRRTFKYPVG